MINRNASFQFLKYVWLLCSLILQDILLLCWAYKPEERPSFSKLMDLLEKLPKRNRRLSHPGHFWKSAEYVKWAHIKQQNNLLRQNKQNKQTNGIIRHRKPHFLKNALNSNASPVMKTACAVCPSWNVGMCVSRVDCPAFEAVGTHFSFGLLLTTQDVFSPLFVLEYLFNPPL